MLSYSENNKSFRNMPERAHKDKTSWTKNWFDANVELRALKQKQKICMLNTYISKIKSCKNEDLRSLLYILRVRTIILMFFGLESVESGEYPERYEHSYVDYRKFLDMDLTSHLGWFEKRSKEEDDIIGGYLYSYALCASNKLNECYSAFTETDKNFGKLRYQKYIETIKE